MLLIDTLIVICLKINVLRKGHIHYAIIKWNMKKVMKFSPVLHCDFYGFGD